MDMNVKNAYNIEVKTETRNHRGAFVQETSYKLVSVTQSGWARICVDDASCHYVDPEHLYMKTEEETL